MVDWCSAGKYLVGVGAVQELQVPGAQPMLPEPLAADQSY